MNKVIRLQESLYNIPHLSLPSTLESVISYLENRNSGEYELNSLQKDATGKKSLEFDQKSKLGVIRIDGPLSYRPTFMSSLCNLSSYQGLLSDVKAMADAGAENIVFIANSGGGEALGCFDTANEIRAIADAYRFKLTAFVDGIAASACYALVSVCDEIVMASDSEVGSVGVVVRLRNVNKGLRAAGIEDSFVFAGQQKVPFADNGNWSKSFIEDIRSKVDSLYENFVGFVSEHRGIDVAVVKATEARMFLAGDALELGLADKVMTRAGFDKYLHEIRTKPMVKPAVNPVATTTATTSTKAPVSTPTQEAPKPDGVRQILQKQTQEASKKALRIQRINRSFYGQQAQIVFNQIGSLNDQDFEEALSRLEKET